MIINIFICLLLFFIHIKFCSGHSSYNSLDNNNLCGGARDRAFGFHSKMSAISLNRSFRDLITYAQLVNKIMKTSRAACFYVFCFTNPDDDHQTVETGSSCLLTTSISVELVNWSCSRSLLIKKSFHLGNEFMDMRERIAKLRTADDARV